MARELSHEANELKLYIDNDSYMYRRKQPFLDNMKRKIAKKKYKPKLGPKLWLFYVQEGTRRYGQEILLHGTSEAGRKEGIKEALRTFSPTVRRELAEDYAREAEHELGYK